jgi:hypothetical protein
LTVVAENVAYMTVPVITCYNVTAAGQMDVLPGGGSFSNSGTGGKLTWWVHDAAQCIWCSALKL